MAFCCRRLSFQQPRAYFPAVAANIPGLTLIGWGWVTCPFPNQSLSPLESDGWACILGSLLKQEDCEDPKT